jgi:hypothetical protein
VSTDREFCRKQHRHTRDLVQRKGQLVSSKHEASPEVFNAEDSSVIYVQISVHSIHKTIIEIRGNIGFFLKCFILTTAILESVMSP